MTTLLVSQTEIETKFPEAFSALPEPYQADSCLEFYLDWNGNLCCSPKAEETPILGSWESLFDPVKQEWITIFN